MFEVDPDKVWVDPAAGPVTNVIQSLNTPLVAAGPHPAEAVQSWIIARQAAGGGAFDIAVFFHLTESNQAVLYRWDGGPVPPPQLDYVQEEALSFCESMGFMMDDLNFGSLAPDARGQLLESLPPFHADLGAFARGDDGKGDGAATAEADPLDDFQRAKQARLEAGQASTADFVPEPSGEEPFAHPQTFDPGTIPQDDLQIEITEVEAVDLLPAEEAALEPVVGTIPPDAIVQGIEEPSGPPLVVGSLQTASAAAPPPIVAGREVTPADQVAVIDADLFGSADVAIPVGDADGGDDEIRIDDVLAEMPDTDGAEIDLSSQLDDILDGVETSQPPQAAAAPPPAPAPAATEPAPAKFDSTEFSIDLTDTGSGNATVSPEEAMAALDALDTLTGPGPNAPEPPAAPSEEAPAVSVESIPPPSPAAPAAEAPAPPTPDFLAVDAGEGGLESLSIDSILGDEDSASDEGPGAAAPAAAPAVPEVPVEEASGPSPLEALEAAWASDGASAPRAATNGRSPASGAVPLDVDVDDLARLLAML